MIIWPAVVVWLFLVAGMISRGPLIHYVGAVAGCCGTLQMLPGELVGGTNFLPGSVYAMLLVAMDPRSLWMLFPFRAWFMVSALVAHRLIAGQVDVILIGARASWQAPHQPISAQPA